MSKIWVAPTGRLITGHVLDCGVTGLSEKLREYDPQLYLKWAPRKLHGWGCWQVRRRPEFKKVAEQVSFGGFTITRLEYIENDFDCHVMDIPFLNYKLLEKLQQIDTWRVSYKAKDFSRDLEYNEGKAQEKIADKAEEERAYSLKQNKTLIRDLMNYVNDGGNPYALADFWK